jgi:hypothetical protein
MDPNNPNQDNSNPTQPQTDMTQSDPQTNMPQTTGSQQDIPQTQTDTPPQNEPSTEPTLTDTTTEQVQSTEPVQAPADPFSQPAPDVTTQSDPNPDPVQEPAPAVDPGAQQADQAVQQPDTTAQTSPDATSASVGGSYIEDVGEDLIDLLDEINEDENLVQAVADEMKLDKERVKGILTKLLTKIDQGQITEDELALIMASTVADEVLNKE